MAQVDLTSYITQLMANAPQSGWNASVISPGNLPVPSSFVTPETVAADAQKAGPTAVKTFSAEDFLTKPIPLNDPKLASRGFTSTPNVPKTVGASVSAYSNMPMPAFLTSAVDRLNQTQSLRALEQADFRQQLLDATLSGNYMAAEALRAAAVNPGSSVSFGSAVLDPNIGASAVIGATSAAAESAVRRNALSNAVTAEQSLKNQLNKVQSRLASLPGNTLNTSPFLTTSSGSVGTERSQLQSEQRRIQQELERQQKNLAVGGAYRASGFASPPVVIGI